MRQLLVFLTSNGDWISGDQSFEIIYPAFFDEKLSQFPANILKIESEAIKQ